MSFWFANIVESPERPGNANSRIVGNPYLGSTSGLPVIREQESGPGYTLGIQKFAVQG
jgi:hypothetical protein